MDRHEEIKERRDRVLTSWGREGKATRSWCGCGWMSSSGEGRRRTVAEKSAMVKDSALPRYTSLGLPRSPTRAYARRSNPISAAAMSFTATDEARLVVTWEPSSVCHIFASNWTNLQAAKVHSSNIKNWTFVDWDKPRKWFNNREA